MKDGYEMYYPPAFDAPSQRAIAANVPPEKRIIVSEKDALKFCCNAINLEQQVFMNGASDELQGRLRDAGFTPDIRDVSEFMKAGGGDACLHLNLG